MQTSVRVRLVTAIVFLSAFLVLNGTAGALTLQWSTWGPEAIDRKLIAAFEQLHPEIKIDYIQTRIPSTISA